MTNLTELKTIMLEQANAAAVKALDEWYRGRDQGACGFAWVMIQPKHKGNTKLGRAERKEFAELGFEKDWTGKRYMYWNPSQLGVQNIDAKEAGARAAAVVLKDAGYDAFAQSRLD